MKSLRRIPGEVVHRVFPFRSLKDSLHCLQFGVIMNEAAANICVQVVV